jgi:hypothetical protein
MNTNEISLKLTADIKGIKSALTQVQKDLKKFGSETTGSTQGLNNALQETEQQLTNISVKSKNFARPAVNQFANLRKGAGAANGSVIAFGRIIQDLPFGILGVANNIQSFSEQFSSLGNDAQKSGSKLGLFFKALITPTNLAVLAVSALTAAWQAYNLGIFDSLFKTESLNDRLKDLNESTKSATANAGVELIKLQNLKSVIEDETVSRDKRLRAVNELIDTYPKLFTLADREKLLNGDLVTSYEILTKAIIAKAKASIAEQELPQLIKQKEIVDLQLKSRQDLLAVEEESLKTASRLTSIQEMFTGSEYEQVARRVKGLNGEVDDLTLKQKELDISIKGYTQSIVSYSNEYEKFIGTNIKSTEKLKRTFEIIPDIKLDRPDITGIGVKLPELDIKGNEGYIQQIQARIEAITQLRDASRNLAEIFAFNLQLGLLQNQLASFNGEEVKSNLELVTDAFASMGAGIASSLNISNRALRGFVTTLISATPKIISAIMAQAAAKTKGAAIGVVADKKESLSGGIKLGVKAAEALGPIGLALLPVFIAGAVALISGAFSKIGGGGGGGSVSAGQGSTFTNRREFGGPVSKGRAYIVGERRPELFVPNTNGIIVPQLPSMDYSGASMAAGAMAVDVNIRGVSYGDDILFTVQQAQIRQGIR